MSATGEDMVVREKEGWWKSFTTVVLRKPGKPKYDVPKAYRPIALLNMMWKVLMGIVADQLTYLAEEFQLLPVTHFSGRPGHTTSDVMHLLTNEIKMSWRAGEVTSVLFLDIEGAFPNAVPSCLVHNLCKCGVPTKIVSFVHNMLTEQITTLKFDGYTSEPINIDNGIGEGNLLLMVLYQFYNADLIEIPKAKGESAMAYVNDSMMIMMASTFPEMHHMLMDMMERVGGVAEWLLTHNSPLKYSKLALVDFAHSRSPKERTPLCLPQKEISPSENTKYLGVIFDQHLNWKAQHVYTSVKGTKWTSQVRRLMRSTWGIMPNHTRRLYMSVAIPRILYAVDIWGSSLGKKGYSKVTRQLTTIQRVGVLAVTGGLRTSPTDTLDASAFLLPAPKLISKWCHRAAARMATLPSEHPLHKVVGRKVAGELKRHKAPINNLLSDFKHGTKEFEKIPAAVLDPMLSGKPPFKISIPPDRESSIREAENVSEMVQVYTDRSVAEGKVGAAAILLRAGNLPCTLHFHLGSDSKHTVHEAELVGILLGLYLISTEKRGNVTFVLGVDNQAAIKAFDSTLRSPGHHLTREAICLANKTQKRRKGTKYAVTMWWTAGHEGIAGNKAADKEAKLAAEGLTSDKHLLPPYLRKCLPINISAVKQAFHKSLKKQWTDEWKASPRGQSIVQLDSSSPSSKFLKAISQGAQLYGS